MQLKVNNYLNSLNSIKTIVVNNPHKAIEEQISIAAVATNVPIVAVCYLYESSFGISDELNSIRDKLIKFYRYDNIIV